MFNEDAEYVGKWTKLYFKIKEGDIQDPEIQAMQKKQETIIQRLDDLCLTFQRTNETLQRTNEMLGKTKF